MQQFAATYYVIRFGYSYSVHTTYIVHTAAQGAKFTFAVFNITDNHASTFFHFQILESQIGSKIFIKRAFNAIKLFGL
jgi:hypothetical protein